MPSPRSAILLPKSSMPLSSPEPRSGGPSGGILGPPRGVSSKESGGASRLSSCRISSRTGTRCSRSSRARANGRRPADRHDRTQSRHSRLLRAIPTKKTRPVTRCGYEPYRKADDRTRTDNLLLTRQLLYLLSYVSARSRVRSPATAPPRNVLTVPPGVKPWSFLPQRGANSSPSSASRRECPPA